MEPVFIILKRISNSSKPQSVCIQSDMSIWEISPFFASSWGGCELLCLSNFTSGVTDLGGRGREEWRKGTETGLEGKEKETNSTQIKLWEFFSCCANSKRSIWVIFCSKLLCVKADNYSNVVGLPPQNLCIEARNNSYNSYLNCTWICSLSCNCDAPGELMVRGD